MGNENAETDAEYLEMTCELSSTLAIFCDTNYLFNIKALEKKLSALSRIKRKDESLVFLAILDFTLSEVIQKAKERNIDLSKSFATLYPQGAFDFDALPKKVEHQVTKTLAVHKVEDPCYRKGCHRALNRVPPAHKKKEMFDSVFWEALIEFSEKNPHAILCFLTENSVDFDMKNSYLSVEARDHRIRVFNEVGRLGDFTDLAIKKIRDLQDDEEKQNLQDTLQQEALSEDGFEKFPDNIKPFDLKDDDSFLQALDGKLSMLFRPAYETGSVLVTSVTIVERGDPELLPTGDVVEHKSTAYEETWEFVAEFEYLIEEHSREYTLEKSGSKSVNGQVVVRRMISMTKGDHPIEENDFEIEIGEDQFDPEECLYASDDDVRIIPSDD